MYFYHLVDRDIYIFRNLYKKHGHDSIPSIWLAATGAVTTVLFIIGTCIKSDKLTASVLLLYMESFFWIFPMIEYRRNKRATERVRGLYTGYKEGGSYRRTVYVPKFIYFFNGKEYHSMSFKGYTFGKILKLFKKMVTMILE